MSISNSEYKKVKKYVENNKDTIVVNSDVEFFHMKKQALASVEYITDTIIPKKSGPHS